MAGETIVDQFTDWAPSGSEQCEATNLMRDDRWGGFRDRCDKTVGHLGPHMIVKNACEPVAIHMWRNDGPIGGEGGGVDHG